MSASMAATVTARSYRRVGVLALEQAAVITGQPSCRTPSDSAQNACSPSTREVRSMLHVTLEQAAVMTGQPSCRTDLHHQIQHKMLVYPQLGSMLHVVPVTSFQS